jgi:WD40 repeat protein
MWTYPYNITKFLIVNEIGTIFMGTSMGKIKAHQWPFTDSMKFSKLFTEIQLHSSAVTELKISPDYNLLISGAEDGSIFISRIIAHSDGIAVSDPEVLSSFKSNYKNYKSLYYLQNYMNTSISIENGQEEIIGQLESDKADFDTEYNDIISTIQESIDKKIKAEEEKKNKELKD